MFNLLTIHLGMKKDAKFYGVEVATLFTETDGYGFLVVLYNVKEEHFVYDIFWMSYVIFLFNKLKKWF